MGRLSISCAVAEVLAEAVPAASPAAGGDPAVPRRYAATLRLLADPLLAVDAPEEWAVAYVLKTLAKDCGYTLESYWLVRARAGGPGSALSGPARASLPVACSGGGGSGPARGPGCPRVWYSPSIPIRRGPRESG